MRSDPGRVFFLKGSDKSKTGPKRLVVLILYGKSEIGALLFDPSFDQILTSTHRFDFFLQKKNLSSFIFA